MDISLLRIPEDKHEAIVRSGIKEFSQKAYADASTDVITKTCGISKGLLFHYFGSKKAFYLHCLAISLERLIVPAPEPAEAGFYGVIFAGMDQKLRLCREYPNDMLFVNMAAREAGSDVAEGKNELFRAYLDKTTAESAKQMARATAMLRLKDPSDQFALNALTLYIGAIINQYMAQYRFKPEEMLEKADEIKAEIRKYIDCMLYGVAKEEVQ